MCLLHHYSEPFLTSCFIALQVCPGQEYQRKLHPDDLPLRALQQRTQKAETCHFLVRRNPNYPRRKQLLPPITENFVSTTSIGSTTTLNGSALQPESKQSTPTIDTNNNKINIHINSNNNSIEKRLSLDSACSKCRNSFKSCDFCQEKGGTLTRSSQRMSVQEPRKFIMNDIEPLSYNPVYNIREIRTVCHSFSSLGIDKKLLDIQMRPTAARKLTLPQKIKTATAATMASVKQGTPKAATRSSCGGSAMIAGLGSKLVKEQVNANPPKGLGNFVYI